MSTDSNHQPGGGHAVAVRAERRWAIFAVALIVLMLAVIVFSGLHWAMMPPSRVETIDPSRLQLSGEFVERQSRQRGRTGRLGDRALHRAAVLVHAAMSAGARRHADHDPHHQRRCRARPARHRHQHQHDGRARLRRHAQYAFRRARRSHDAVPRVLRLRPSGHVGARQGHRQSHLLQSQSPTIHGGSAVLHAKRLVLAHFWLAFIGVRIALLLGAWQMLVRSPLHAVGAATRRSTIAR